jgi:predicted nucleotidyltransferase
MPAPLTEIAQAAAPPPILSVVPTQLDSALEAALLTTRERQVLQRTVKALKLKLGDDLRAAWLYGSRARGERTHADSDVDLLVIATGDVKRAQRLALELSEAAAIAEGESPFTYSIHVYDPNWLHGRREIDSFFIQEVDRDKLVLAGSEMPKGVAA